MRSTEKYGWDKPDGPTECPNGYPLKYPNAIVSYTPRACKPGNGGHRTWTGQTCWAEIFGPKCVDPTENPVYRPR